MAHWASNAIARLQNGESATVTPHGNSMLPRVKSGETVSLSIPIDLKVGQVVLVKVKGRVMLHLISAIDSERYQISNNKGRVNGWVKRSAIYGVADK